MEKKINAKTNKGYSLIELLITITIIVIAASAVIPVLTFVTQANSNNKIRSTANSIATSIFEEINSMKYEDIGVPSGSPAGTVITPREVTVDGVTYKVDIQISWGSATNLGEGRKVNPVAFKNIRVIVKAMGAFTGTEDTFDKMYSIVAKEGHQSILNKGNILVQIKDSNNASLSSLSLNIKAQGPKTYNILAEEGQVIFGEIDLGTYSVSVPVPAEYAVPQNETVESGSAIRKNIIIDSWNVKNIYFYMDKLEKYSNLNIKIIDEEGNILPQTGKIEMKWVMDDTESTVFSDRSFTNGTITSNTIGRLWPLGIYNIIITYPPAEGIPQYNMAEAIDKPIIKETDAEWDGTFSTAGETINLLIRKESKPIVPTRDAFSRIEAESYDEYSGNYIRESGDGGEIIRGMRGTNYTVYKNVDFDSGAFRFIARAAGRDNMTVTLKVDGYDNSGTTIGTLNFNRTSRYNDSTYQEQSCWVNGITGVHDLYIIYSGNFRFNWFTFKRADDNFNDNTISSAWTFKNGTWVENDGVLKQTSSDRQDPKKAILSNAGYNQNTNYTIMAKVMVESGKWSNSDEARAGVGLFTNTDTGYGYNLLFHNTRNTVQFLDDARGWSDEFTYSWTENKWYWFKLKSEGRQLYGKIWEDGSTEPDDWLFQYTFPNTSKFRPQRTGYPSLNGGSGNCQVWFDDVSVIEE